MLCKNINELFSSSIEEFNFEYDAYNFLIVQITFHLKILNSGAIGDCGGLYVFFKIYSNTLHKNDNIWFILSPDLKNIMNILIKKTYGPTMKIN